MTTPSTHDLKDEVLQKIRTGDVHMKSKSYFAWQVIALAFVAALIVIIAAWIVSFVVFSLNISERAFLLGFGWRGIRTFLLLFPWKLALVELLLIVFLNWLIHRFRFSYRSPLLYSLLGGFVLSGVLAWVMHSGSIQQVLLDQHYQNNLPVIGSLYERLERPDDQPNVVRGIVVEIKMGGILMQDIDKDALINVIFPEGLVVGHRLLVGDEIFVAGEMTNHGLEAYGVKKVIHFKRKPIQ
jgi:hypothetical protein